MAEVFDESNGVEKLYEYSARLSEAKDKSLHVDDYKRIIEAVNSSSIKARQLAAQLIPRFFKFFPALSDLAVDKHCDLCEAEELGLSVSSSALCDVTMRKMQSCEEIYQRGLTWPTIAAIINRIWKEMSFTVKLVLDQG